MAGTSREAFFSALSNGDTTLFEALSAREKKSLLAEESPAPFFMLSIERERSGSSGTQESFHALLHNLKDLRGPLAREALVLAIEEFRDRLLTVETRVQQRALERLWRKRIQPFVDRDPDLLSRDALISDAFEEIHVLMGTQKYIEQSVELLFSGELTESLARRSTYPPLVKALDALPAFKRGVIAARLMVWKREYGPAMNSFEVLKEEDPDLFYSLSPKVLSDYGRAVQYAGTSDWGAFAFTGFDADLMNRSNPPETLSDIDLEARRFVFLFYAGRMHRQNGNSGEAGRLFLQSLAFAPDAIQRDAVLWYLLEDRLRGETQTLLEAFEDYMPLVSDRSSFSNLFDRLQGRLLAEKRFEDLAKSHRLVLDWGDLGARLRSRWILARVVDLGYLEAGRARSLLEIPATLRLRDWTEAQYHEIFDADNASFYYRSLAAIVLGKTVNPMPPAKPVHDAPSYKDGTLEKPVSHPILHVDAWSLADWMNWVLAVKKWGLTDLLEGFAGRYRNSIPPEVTGEIARIQAGRGDHYQSIRTMGTLLGRPDYRISRDDLLLLYPRAWQQELDTAAMVWGVPPEIMAGLARSESAFRAEVASHAGAVGLVQIMPATGRDIAARIAKRVPLVMNGAEPDLTDAFTNAQLGAWYLADWTERLSSPMLALFAYNAGPGRVRQWRSERSSLPEDLFLETVPFDETRNYGRRVLSAAAVYGYLYYGYDMSQVAKDLFGPGTDFSIRSAE